MVAAIKKIGLADEVNARTTMLTAYDVMEQTGIGYHNALALIKVHGIRVGKRGYRISAAALARALDPEGQQDMSGR